MIMNATILIFVSLPEAFLNLMIILLFAGARGRLKINKPNGIRFIIALALMLTASWFIRPIALNVVMNMTLHIIAYVLIITLIYWENVVKIAFSVALTLLIYSAVENSYIPLIIAYVSKGIDSFFKNIPLLILYSLPYRMAQIAAIILLYKTNIIMVISKVNRKFRQIFAACFIILIFLEYYFSYIFGLYFDKMHIVHQMTYSITLFVMLIVFNILILKFIDVAVRGVVTKGFQQYTELEENAKHAFLEVHKLLKNNNVNAAIKLLEELTEDEEKQTVTREVRS